jgi:hypothetical protein
MLDSHCEDMVLIPGESYEICDRKYHVWVDSYSNTFIFHNNNNFNNAADHSVNSLCMMRATGLIS